MENCVIGYGPGNVFSSWIRLDGVGVDFYHFVYSNIYRSRIIINSEWNNSEVSFYGEIEVQRHKIGTFRVGWYVDTIVFRGPNGIYKKN